MSDEIDRLLMKHGLTEGGKASQAYRAIRKAFTSGDVYDHALGQEESESKRVAAELHKQRTEAEKTLGELKSAKSEAKDKIRSYGIKDIPTIEALNLYSEVLERTKVSVGDGLTEEIWLKAIEAGSYGMWRTIMGPKFDDKGYGRR